MHQGFDHQAIGRYVIDIDGCLRATNAMLVKVEDIIALHGRLAHDALLVQELNGETIPIGRRERVQLSEDRVSYFRSSAGSRLFRACAGGRRSTFTALAA